MTRCGRLLLTLNFPCFCLEPQGFSDKILPTSAKWNLPTTKSELVLMRTVTWLLSNQYPGCTKAAHKARIAAVRVFGLLVPFLSLLEAL